jgi:hypothetical protein
MAEHERPDRPERPGPAASEAELAEWRARDFGWALATAMGEEEAVVVSSD